MSARGRVHCAFLVDELKGLKSPPPLTCYPSHHSLNLRESNAETRCGLRSPGRSISEFRCRAGRRSRAVGGGQGNDSGDGQGNATGPATLTSSPSLLLLLAPSPAYKSGANAERVARPPATGLPALQALAFGSSQSPVSCLFFPSGGLASAGSCAFFFPPLFTLGGDKTVASLPPSHHRKRKHHPGLPLPAGQQRCLALPPPLSLDPLLPCPC
jgi:hypothetical protein